MLTFFYGIFTIALILCAVEDHQHNRLPDKITLPCAVVGLAANCFQAFVDFSFALLGALSGFASLQFLRLVHLKYCGRTGIGYGDAKFLGTLGAWLGLQSIPMLLVGASAMMLIVYRKRTEKPFGVGLSTCALGLAWAKISGNG